MSTDFLTSMAAATKDLTVAQARRASMLAKARTRLSAAQSRFDCDVDEARLVEAEAWKRLMAVPGITAATAAQLGGTTAIKVSRWIRLGNGD